MTIPPWNAFPYHHPGRALTFPRDEGWHAVLPLGLANPSPTHMEWVYLNSHLDEVGGAGRKLVVFAAYFTQGLRFFVVRAWDAQDRYLGQWTGSAIGMLTVSEEELDVKFRHGGGTDTWKGKRDASGAQVPFCSHLSAIDDAGELAVSLELSCQKRPYEAGDVGWLPFGRTGWFGYYSLTRVGIAGTVTLPRDDGTTEEVPVSGFGWYDHQWGPFFVTPFRMPGRMFEAYEWMSLQLERDDGAGNVLHDELLLTTVWDTTGETPSRDAFGGAGLVRHDGSTDHDADASLWKRTKFWRADGQGSVYSAGWTYKSPRWDLELTITPRHADQLTPFFDASPAKALVGAALEAMVEQPGNWLADFWEGSCSVTGTFEGRPVRGYAFAELVKRYADPELEVHVPRNERDLTVVAWRVTNWDGQAPMRYRFFLETGDGRILVDRPDLDVSVTVLDDPTLPRGTELVARIVAHSIDGTLSSTVTRRLVLP